MKKSNIFAYIELSKLVDELRTAGTSENLKEKLKSKSAYFNIIEPKYFSDSLIDEWEEIRNWTKRKGAMVDEDGKVISNATFNTIESFTSQECQRLAELVYLLYEKVKKELV